MECEILHISTVDSRHGHVFSSFVLGSSCLRFSSFCNGMGNGKCVWMDGWGWMWISQLLVLLLSRYYTIYLLHIYYLPTPYILCSRRNITITYWNRRMGNGDGNEWMEFSLVSSSSSWVVVVVVSCEGVELHSYSYSSLIAIYIYPVVSSAFILGFGFGFVPFLPRYSSFFLLLS